MDLEYRWKSSLATGAWYLMRGADDVDHYDDVARQALSINDVERVTFRMGDGSRLQYRRAKQKKAGK